MCAFVRIHFCFGNEFEHSRWQLGAQAHMLIRHALLIVQTKRRGAYGPAAARARMRASARACVHPKIMQFVLINNGAASVLAVRPPPSTHTPRRRRPAGGYANQSDKQARNVYNLHCALETTHTDKNTPHIICSIYSVLESPQEV